MTVTEKWRGFIVTPRRVDQIDPDGEFTAHYDADGLYDALVLAGYPLTDDESLGGYFVDLSVDPDNPDKVTAYSSGPAPNEYCMGEASRTFLAWYVLNVPDGEDGS